MDLLIFSLVVFPPVPAILFSIWSDGFCLIVYYKIDNFNIPYETIFYTKTK